MTSASATPLNDRPEACPVCGTKVGPGASGSSTAGEQSYCPRCGHLLWYESTQVGNVTIIRMIDNRLAVMELLELLDNAIEDGLTRRLLINFGAIQQVSSAALGKLVKLMGQAEKVRGRLKLCGLHVDLRQVFRITRLDQCFEIFETEREAMESFEASEGR